MNPDSLSKTTSVLQCTLTSGIKIALRSMSDWTIFTDVFVNNEYDQAIDMALENAFARQSVYVLDLGANSGLFSLRLGHLAHGSGFRGSVRVIAIEGSPLNVRRLEESIRASSLPDNINVMTVHGLVGFSDGIGHIKELSFDGMSHVVDSGGVAVPYTNINTLVENWPVLDLIKCDVEGSEYAFVKTYPHLLQNTRVAVFEFHAVTTSRVSEYRDLVVASGLTNRRLLRSFGDNTVEMFWR